MFSVGASPYNSADSQLYGGWNVEQAGDNIWGKKQAYLMTSRFSPSESARKAANKWLKMYRVAAQDPAFRARVREEGKPYWSSAIMPKMTDAQKRAIYAAWLATDFDQTPRSQIRSRLIRKAPYPGATITNFNRMLGVPFLGANDPLGDRANMGAWRTVKDLEDEFKARRTINRSYTADEVADAFGVSAADAQRYMDSLTEKARARRRARAVKQEDEEELA